MKICKFKLNKSDCFPLSSWLLRALREREHQILFSKHIIHKPLIFILMWLVVGCLFSFRIIFTVAHYYLVAAFVRSKPPGRKMVYINVNIRIYLELRAAQILYLRLPQISVCLHASSAI